jgi:hypothetical protein
MPTRSPVHPQERTFVGSVRRTKRGGWPNRSPDCRNWLGSRRGLSRGRRDLEARQSHRVVFASAEIAQRNGPSTGRRAEAACVGTPGWWDSGEVGQPRFLHSGTRVQITNARIVPSCPINRTTPKDSRVDPSQYCLIVSAEHDDSKLLGGSSCRMLRKLLQWPLYSLAYRSSGSSYFGLPRSSEGRQFGVSSRLPIQ